MFEFSPVYYGAILDHSELCVLMCVRGMPNPSQSEKVSTTNMVIKMFGALLTKKDKEWPDTIMESEKPYHLRLESVCRATAAMLGRNSIAHAYSVPAMRSLLGLLGLCRTTCIKEKGSITTVMEGCKDVDFNDKEPFEEKEGRKYTAADVFKVKIGAGTALDRIVKGEWITEKCEAALSSIKLPG
jgi:hypothetical protein